jgi:hypothetical protein
LVNISIEYTGKWTAHLKRMAKENKVPNLHPIRNQTDIAAEENHSKDA